MKIVSINCTFGIIIKYKIGGNCITVWTFHNKYSWFAIYGYTREKNVMVLQRWSYIYIYITNNKLMCLYKIILFIYLVYNLFVTLFNFT